MSILPILLAFSFLPCTVQLSAECSTAQTVKSETIKVFVNTDGGLTVRSSVKQPLNFYLFDLEGTLIYQSSITQHESKTIEGLTKGTYLYNAFQNDTSIDEGKITLK